MHDPGRLPAADKRSRFLAELPAQTEALTALAFQFAEDRGAPHKRRQLQAGLEALARGAQAAGEANIADHAEAALACLEVCEQSEDEAPAHIVAELQMLVSALPWLALAEAPGGTQSGPAPRSPGPAAPVGESAAAPKLASKAVSKPASSTSQVPLGVSGSRPRVAVGSAAPAAASWGSSDGSLGSPLGSSPGTSPGHRSGLPMGSDRSVKQSGARRRATALGPGGPAPHESSPGTASAPQPAVEPFVVPSAGDDAEFELSEGPVVLTQTVSGLVSPAQPAPIMVIEQPDVVARIRAALPRTRFTVTGSTEGEEALLLLASVRPLVVLLPLALAADRQARLVQRLREHPCQSVQKIVLLAAELTPERVADLECDAWLPTPVDPDAIVPQMERLVGGSGEGSSSLRSLTEGTVDDIVDGVADEIRRGLLQSLRVGREERIVIDDREELLAAAWSAIGRVRTHLSQRSGGRVRFSQEVSEQGAPGVHGGDEHGRRGQASAKEAPEAAAVIAGCKVLVADDDPAVLWFFSGLLREAGATVLEAKNGREALQLCRAHRPHLVVSDILMPKLDGFALCRELKRDVVLWDVPVILLSWKEDFLLRMRELQPGAVGYLRKESGGRQILQTIAAALAPRDRLEKLLATPEEIHGRVEQVGVLSLLELVATHRPDARVTIRDPFNLYEIELRQGQHLSASRTATDGSFARGQVVLQQLLGVRTGRFSVEPGVGPLRGGVLQALLPTALQDAARRLSAILDAVSGDFTLRIAKVLFDNRMLLALSEVSPPALTEFVRNVLKEDAPLRERLLSGELEPQAVEGQLRELARLGAISAVWDVSGADLIAEAHERLNQDPERLVHALGSTVPTSRSAAPPPPAGANGSGPAPRTAATARTATVGSTRAPVSKSARVEKNAAARPAATASATAAKDAAAKDAAAKDAAAKDAAAKSALVQSTKAAATPTAKPRRPAKHQTSAAALRKSKGSAPEDEAADVTELYGMEDALDTTEGSPLTEFPPSEPSVRLVLPDLASDADGPRVEAVALAATLEAQQANQSAPASSAAASNKGSHHQATLPAFMAGTTERAGASAAARPDERDPLDATAGFALLQAGLADTAPTPRPDATFFATSAGRPAPTAATSYPSPPPLPSRRPSQRVEPMQFSLDDDSPSADLVRTAAKRRRSVAPSGAAGSWEQAVTLPPVTSLQGRLMAFASLLALGALGYTGVWLYRTGVPTWLTPGNNSDGVRLTAPVGVSSDADKASRRREAGEPTRVPDKGEVAEPESGSYGTEPRSESALAASDPKAAYSQSVEPERPWSEEEPSAGGEGVTEPAESSDTLAYIDPQYGIDVAADEGLLVVLGDAQNRDALISVRIGGQELGAVPTAVALPEGPHEVVFRSGDQTRFRYVVIHRGETRRLSAP